MSDMADTTATAGGDDAADRPESLYSAEWPFFSQELSGSTSIMTQVGGYLCVRFWAE
jgi:hypothetical protein